MMQETAKFQKVYVVFLATVKVTRGRKAEISPKMS